MKEIHELQEEKLMITQVKAKTTLEKSQAKSLKKAMKSGNAENVEAENIREYQKLIHEQENKVPQQFKMATIF